MRTDEIVNKHFSRSFMGYDIEQVDLFLDEIIEVLERYEEEKREMLSAMEYLMKKLERGQKMPLSDLKKAIDFDRGQPKETLPEGAGTAREGEQKTSARSIARGNGGQSKQARAPKVSRVKGEESAKAQLIEEAKAAIPHEELSPEEAEKRARRMSAAAADWLDELLINIAEHESGERDKQPQAPLQPDFAPASQPQPEPAQAEQQHQADAPAQEQPAQAEQPQPDAAESRPPESAQDHGQA